MNRHAIVSSDHEKDHVKRPHPHIAMEGIGGANRVKISVTLVDHERDRVRLHRRYFQPCQTNHDRRIQAIMTRKSWFG
jgi:hypothetical protein